MESRRRRRPHRQLHGVGATGLLSFLRPLFPLPLCWGSWVLMIPHKPSGSSGCPFGNSQVQTNHGKNYHVHPKPKIS